MSNLEIQRMQKRREDEKALQRIRAQYPQCGECLYHFKSLQLLVKHVCGGVVMPHDVLSSAMKHANQLLSRMDFSVEGAVDRASSMFNTEVTYATFESNFYAGWAHTRKCMHPELTSKVSGIIHQCWQAGNSTELGKVKISVDGVFARLDEMQLQKVIRISELPLAGNIRSVYQSIGRKPEAPRAAGRKRGRMQGSDGPTSGQKKARITYEQLDLGKNVSQWKKHELEAYLCHHRIAKTGNKPELVMRVSEHIQIARIEQE